MIFLKIFDEVVSESARSKNKDFHQTYLNDFDVSELFSKLFLSGFLLLEEP